MAGAACQGRRIATLGAAVLALLGAGCGSRPIASVFPGPGTPTASRHTQISFRGAGPDDLGTVTVTGSRSGRHAGVLRAHPDGDGASFVPARPFRPGEQVIVRAGGARLRGAAGGAVRFSIAGVTHPAPLFTQPANPARAPGTIQRFRSAPGLRPPVVRVMTDRPGTAPGDLFVAPKLGASRAGPMLLDPHGRLLWFAPMPGDQQAFDFRVQRYEGRPVLTWWQGTINGFHGIGHGNVVDSSYRLVARVAAGNGYHADLHELRLTPQGTALITIYHAVPWDLAGVGGPRHGSVWDGIVQEVDVRTGLVEFEWHSLGHVALDESYADVPSKPDVPYDYFHVNSIDLEPNGNLLVSARHTHALYEIDHRTGAIRWRMGGRRSDFRMGPGTHFAWQHDARRQADGTITLFDNGSDADVAGIHSRGLVLGVDERRRRVRLLHAYTHPGGLLAPTQGSMQLLPNGDAFVGWGGENPTFSEFAPGGRLLFDAQFAPAKDESYRAFRLPWTGRPAEPPSLAAVTRRGRTTVWASWNGATGVARWQVLAGPRGRALRPVRTVPRTGFETRIAVAGAPQSIAVRALDGSGATLRTSPPVRPRAG